VVDTRAVVRSNNAVAGLDGIKHDLSVASVTVGLAETVNVKVTCSQSVKSGSFPQNL
jgi:hypothetical protein